MANERQFGKIPPINEGDCDSISTAKEKIKRTPPEIAIHIVGPTGIGKTTMVKELAEELGIALLHVSIWNLDSMDLSVMSAVVELEQWLEEQKSKGVDISRIGTSSLPSKLAAWLPYVNLLPIPAIHGDKGIWFIDNFPLDNPLLLPKDVTTLFQLIFNRRVGGYTLPDGWRVIIAGLRDDDKFLRNRIRRICISEPKSEEQRQDMYRWFYEHNVHPSIIAFLKFCPDAIFDEPKPTDQEEVLAFPTPRTWHMFSEQIMYPKSGLLDENGNLIKDKLLLFSECAGFVGKRWAKEYADFVSVFYEIPDSKTILEKGLDTALKEGNKSMPAPNEVGKMHALITSVVSHLKDMHKNPTALKNFLEFAKALKVGEFEMPTIKEAWRIKVVREAYMKSIDLLQTYGYEQEFVQFCKDHNYMIS